MSACAWCWLFFRFHGSSHRRKRGKGLEAYSVRQLVCVEFGCSSSRPLYKNQCYLTFCIRIVHNMKYSPRIGLYSSHVRTASVHHSKQWFAKVGRFGCYDMETPRIAVDWHWRKCRFLVSNGQARVVSGDGITGCVIKRLIVEVVEAKVDINQPPQLHATVFREAHGNIDLKQLLQGKLSRWG
jgi:hypothetical protein